MMRDNPEKTKAGNLKKASPEQICEWIVEAWDEISPEVIRKSFLKAGISNNMDGSEDDWIFDDHAADVFDLSNEGPLNLSKSVLFYLFSSLNRVFRDDLEDEAFQELEEDPDPDWQPGDDDNSDRPSIKAKKKGELVNVSDSIT